MINLMWVACAVIVSFWRLMSICLNPRYDWDVSPLALLFLTTISARRKWLA